MNAIIEKLACKCGEGFQSSVSGHSGDTVNVFHRAVVTHESSDLSFIIGLVTTGLRGTAFVDGEKVIPNYNQLLTANRQHIPLVVNTNARLVGGSTFSTANDYSHIHAVQSTGCFQFVARSAQEEVYLTLIAHRIAELALIPGMVIADYSTSDKNAMIPDDELIRRYLGSPDDQIQCPTPSQEMIFGRTRRRIPNWYSLDLPVMLGAKKDSEGISFEAGASEKYFHDHLVELIDQAFVEFEQLFGINLHPVNQGSTSDYAVIALGSQISELSENNSKNIASTDIISVNQLNPFPIATIASQVKGKKSVTVLEPVSGSSTGHSTFYFNVVQALEGAHTKIYSGKYNADLDAASLELAIEHMVTNQDKLQYYLGLAFTREPGNYPKHNILLQEIGKQYPGISSESLIADRNPDADGVTVQDDVPLAVRTYKDHGPNYTRLSRFYDDTAFFYAHDEHHELTADPFSAVPVIPAASASFFNQSQKRTELPVFDTKKCTACGDCFVHCPHSALPPIVIGVEQLMKAGMDMAANGGMVITKLTPLIKNLAKVTAKSIKDTDIYSVQDFLPSAFENLTTQMKLDGDKLDAVKREFEAVMAEVGTIPVAITDQLFNLPDAQEKGRGEFFSLALNPTACTGCGICAAVCEEEALTMELEESISLETVRRQFKLWEQLPDTSVDTMKRLLHDDQYSSLAAIMLSKNYTMTMSGASDSSENNAYKTLLHIITATAESIVQPKIVSQLKEIDQLITATSENIHKNLSQGLPKEDLEGLTKSLKRARGRKVSIQDLVNQMPEQERGQLFDSAVLERKANLVEDLKNLHWVLSEGPTAVGRSRFGMLLAGSSSMDWAKKYPANHFTNPTVIHWNGSAPEQTLGLFYGQLRYLLDNIKLMRRAKLEAKDKYDPSVHDLEIAMLGWGDLTDKEKELIPPILLVAERDDLNELGWSSLHKLLADTYPVKVFLLDHITSPKKSAIPELAQINAGLFSTIAIKKAFVFQGGIGNTEHLVDGLMEGLDKSYPALFNLYTTKFERHGVTNINWSPYAALALNSRAFPCLAYDPQAESGFLNGSIVLDGNKQSDQDWVLEEMDRPDQDAIQYHITWADWAFTQSDWKDQFTPMPDGNNCVMISEYLKLPDAARQSQLPAILRGGDQGLKYYSVTDQVVEMTEAVLSHWNTLRELAGILTEFPIKLREEVTKELHEKYAKNVADLTNKYEEQLQAQEAAQTEQLRRQLKEKLVALSRMAQSKPKV